MLSCLHENTETCLKRATNRLDRLMGVGAQCSVQKATRRLLQGRGNMTTLTYREAPAQEVDPELIAAIESCRSAHEKRTRTKPAGQPEPERKTAQVIQLPLWPE